MAKQKAPPAPLKRGRGQPSIFEGKNGDRLQGNVTPIGSTRFEQARGRLAKLAAWDVEDVSDGDTFEYLARGEDETRVYLQRKRIREKAS